MFKHNLLLIYRNFKRHKTTFLINLTGLSCGLACVLLIYLWVNDELSFDKYHANDSRLYQVMANIKSDKGIDTKTFTPHSLAELLPSEMPAVEYAATVTPDLFLPPLTLSANDKKIKSAGRYAGKDFFKIFSYHLIQGNESNVLANTNSIALSESQAQSLFRLADNAIGKTIEWEVAGIKGQSVVTGIFKDVPINSSEHFDVILPFDAFKGIMGMDATPSWGPEPFATYLVVRNGTDIDRLNNNLNKYIQNKSKDTTRTYFVKRFSDNYLYGKFENGKQAGGRIEYVKLFSLIALFILVISSINFMNLSTAKATKRIKEIGIKKAMGVERRILVLQYLGEALLMSFLSLIVAIIVVFLLLPQFNEITQKNLHFYFDLKICLALLSTTIITGLLSGSYPALYLSGFKAAIILKGKKLNNSIAEKLVRKGLVVFQFSLSIIFIVSVVVLYGQINYMQNRSPGFDRNNVIYFDLKGNSPDAYLNEIKGLPGIENASSMRGNFIGDKFGGQSVMDWNGRKIPVHSFAVNYGMIETLGIKIKEGGRFRRASDPILLK